MRFTQYFLFVRQRVDRARIKMEWIEDAGREPECTEIQSDGRIRKWKWIEEENKALRSCITPRWRDNS